MEIKFITHTPYNLKLKTFLEQQGISRRLLAKIKYDGGDLLVNGQSQTVRAILKQNDVIKIVLPPEKNRKHPMIPSYVPLDILYEDRDFLIVNKPARVASIPSLLHPNDSLINRVFGYYQIRGYQGILPHIVTRLDRDTSGIVLFAKHRYAHALMDAQLRERRVQKVYLAILSGQVNFETKEITAPIARCNDSTMKREVNENGQFAWTTLTVTQRLQTATLCSIKLHTGRTHQIRVHCAYLGYPLIGDGLYGGLDKMPLQRQGLHCHSLTFYHPFQKQWVNFLSPLPEDMNNFLQQNN